MDMYDSLNILAEGRQSECAGLVSLIQRWLAEKGFADTGQNPYVLKLIADETIEGDGYAFDTAENGGEIRASRLGGLYAGAGHFLLNAQIHKGRLCPGAKPVISIPRKKVRGMYFATHFHNFYHDAPLDEVLRYVEELALWGYNALSVWFDMHHYTGLDDPEEVAMVGRLRAILQKAQESGMQPCLGVLGNEGFSTTPDAQKAQWKAQNGHSGLPGGHYHVEICPNAPGGMELLLQNREEVFRAFLGIDFKYIWIWPYDQGGCTCEKCAPWGASGFLRTAPRVAELARKHFPECKIILSLWLFGASFEDELGIFAKNFKNEGGYADFILCEPDWRTGKLPVREGEVCGLPVVGFPEISMYGCTPWGGFGANPLPGRIRQLWDECESDMQGGFPYSEGIYEDINKFVISRMYWHGDYDVDAALAEYARAYFGGGVAEVAAGCLSGLEHTLFREVQDPNRIMIKNPGRCKSIYDALSKCDAEMSQKMRASWRWRIVYLRALIDKEASENDFYATPACREAYDELTAIYHAQNANLWVRPPTDDFARLLAEDLKRIIGY